VLLSATTIFSASGPILYFTEGAAKTTTLGYWLFAQVRGGTYNYPSAVGVIFTLLTIPIVVFVRTLSKKINAEVTY
jgi:ABC-type sugar transport system permease subunit